MKLGKVIKVVRVADVEDGDALEATATTAGATTLAESSTDYAQAKELVN